MRRIAVLSALVLAGGLIGPSTALATEDDASGDDGRWIAVEDQFAIVLPNGETLTDDAAMEGPQEEVPPSAPGRSSARSSTPRRTGPPGGKRSAATTSSAPPRSRR